MKILIEQYGYDKERLSKLLDPHYFTELRDGKAKIPYVGYFLSRRIPDIVFILPKVFIIDGKAFGEYEPEAIIDFENLKQEHQTNVFNLSVWVYRAIKLYFQRKEKYGEEAEIMQNVVSHQGPRSETMIDIILTLLKFDKEHKNLFTYITRLKHSSLNKIHWQKTISNTQALIQNGTPVYLNPHTKQKDINFDEELIVLFYSVLNYLNREFKFNVRPAFGYELLKPETIQSMIDSGKGVRILRQNRRKYFTDEMVHLWNLLFTFFEQSQYVQSKDNDDEQAMLVREFNLVFEDMIDSLIGDNSLPKDLKEQKDGKIIDHIYRDSSLIEDKKQIYFIGDSKYYKDDNDIGPNSIYKQFTYAKNVIQYNIDFFNRKPKEFERENLQYRDNTTEGYNITPNFFIRGHLQKDQLDNYKDDNLQLVPVDDKEYQISYHFPNRLFDRDTLILQTYNINFLFVLSCYVQGAGEHTQKIRSIFRENIKSVLQLQYNFFAIKPRVQNEAEQFLHDNFQQVLGKVFAPYASSTNCMALALDKGVDNTDILDLIDKYFYRKLIPQKQLDIEPNSLFSPDEKTIIQAPTPVDEDAWVLLIERSVSDDDLVKKIYPQLTKAQYIAVGIGLSVGDIDVEPALLSAKYVVVHNKCFGRMSCLAGKAKFVMANAVDEKFFIAKGKDSGLYVAYEIDHGTQPPIVSTYAEILRLSEHRGYDTRFVKLSDLR
ncbi:MAG: LlaJI family restriction endonuclease [Bacteroidales bacterium]|nr:LlaJI family restriction endonuclease [Bacteroidales bacterium]